MLLTDIFSFGIDSQKVISADHADCLYHYFKRKLALDLTSSETYDEYCSTSKSTEKLNQELWQLLVNREDKITDSQVMSVLSYPDPFDFFDDKTWALLHLACMRCDAKLIRHRLYAWVLSTTSNLKNVIQARLFLMSQPGFDLKRAGVETIVIPILQSSNFLDIFAVLSHPDFNIKFFNNHIAAIQEITSINLPHLLPFVKSAGLEPREKEALLENILALNIDKNSFSTDINILTTFIIISSSVKNITSELMVFLIDIANKLIDSWNISLTQSQSNKVQAKREGGGKEVTLENMSEDFRKENARKFTNQFLSLIAVPGMLDGLLQDEIKKDLTQKMNEILACYATSFFRDLTHTLWKEQNSSDRVCSDQAVDWVMSLEAFSSLSFLTSIDPSTAKTILTTVIQVNDIYFLDKLFDLNRQHDKHPVFSILVSLDYTDVQYNSQIDSFLRKNNCVFKEPFHIYMQCKKDGSFDNYLQENNTPIHLLALAKKSWELYVSKRDAGVTRLFQDPCFNILEHYEGASEGFKALPKVKMMMELNRIFNPKATKEDLEGWSAQVPDVAVAVNMLTGRYLEQFKALVIMKESAGEEKEIVYKRIKRLHEVIKKLPGGVRCLIDAIEDPDKKLELELVCIKFQLRYRIELYEHVLKKREGEAKISGSAPYRKEVKVQFLVFISDRIDEIWSGTRGNISSNLSAMIVSEDSSARKRASIFNLDASVDKAAFLFSAYLNFRLSEGKKALSSDKERIKIKFKDWILHTVLKSSRSSKTAQTLACLPDEMIAFIFKGTGVSCEDVLAAAGMRGYSQERRLAALDKIDNEESSDKATPASNDAALWNMFRRVDAENHKAAGSGEINLEIATLVEGGRIST